jgi:hypothetical chaperone protein
LRLGIDFGTTNSAVSLYDGQSLIAIQVDPDNENPDVLPSLIYIDRQHNSTQGIAAAFEFLDKEIGRQVRWQKRLVGDVEIIVAGSGDVPIRYLHDLHALIDVNANGRLLQSVKTILRNPLYDGTRIFDRFYTLDTLIELLLQNLKQAAQNAFGQSCNSVVMGRPVKFSDNPGTDRRAEEILYKAARAAGFDEIGFAAEPLAVAHLQHMASDERHTALVFDFGGGTLDLTIAEIGGDEEPNILATKGVLVGGDDLDAAIMHYLTKYFGANTKIGKDKYSFPYDMLESLFAWQTMPKLSQVHYMSRIKEFQEKSDDPQAMLALEHLVSHNLGYQLFREIERVKKELSFHMMVKLEFQNGPINILDHITQMQFNKMISAEVEKVESGINDVLRLAEMSADQIDVVLRTGGSSIVPVFRNMLSDIFGEDKLREIDPMVSVVAGMAVIAANTDLPTPSYAIRYTQDNPICNVQAKSDHQFEIYQLSVGERCYVDDDFVISRCPVILNGLPTIRTATRNDSEYTLEDFLSFDIEMAARIYVAYDPMATKRPEWLQSFSPEDMQIEINEEWRGERALRLHSKIFEPGTIVLGGNKARGHQSSYPALNYVVIVQVEIPRL